MIHSRFTVRTGLLLALILLAFGVTRVDAIVNGQAANLVLGQPDFTTNTYATTASTMTAPASVAIDPTSGKVFVAEYYNNRVLRFASSAALANGAAAEGVLGQPNFTTATDAVTTQTSMYSPLGLAIDSAGTLWVADTDNSRVLRFDHAATLANGAAADGVLGQLTFTTKTDATTQRGMRQPAGLAIDSAGTLWVADTVNYRVLRFDHAATLANGAAADGVLGQPDFTTKTAFTVTALGMFQPYGVAMDQTGTLWVADTGNRRVLRFDQAAALANGAAAGGVLGQPNFITNTPATTASRVNFPTGVAVDSGGTLWVVDSDNNRVLRFANAATLANGAAADGVLGQVTFTTNTSATTASTMTVPFGVTVESTRHLWVADYGNHRVLRFATGDQTITVDPLAPATIGAPPFTVHATASSGLPVTLRSTTPAVCSVNGSTVTLLATGTCTIAADQAGDSEYTAAPSVTQSFTVAQATQTIAFAGLPNKTVGDPAFPVSATASSNLPVTFTSTTFAVCTVSGSTVTLLGAGICTIAANQAGDPTYSAAPPVSQSFVVNPTSTGTQPQTITFAPLPAKTVGEPAFGVRATASSGLTVTLSSTTPAVCMIDGSLVTLLAAGTCTITAEQAGNASYHAARPVSQSFVVNPVSTGTHAQTITWDQVLSPLVYGTAPVTLTATASSGLSVSYSTTTPTVCTVDGSILTLVRGGDCILTADQPGNATYAAATPVTRTTTITPLPQAITFGSLPALDVGDAPITLTATASSGLTVTFASLTPTVCTVSGTTVAPIAVGLCQVTATQAGNAHYRAAPDVVQSVVVAARGTPHPRLYLPLATR